MTGSRHRVWQLALAITLSALLLWWAFRDVNLAEALGYLRAVRLGWLLAAVLVATSLFPLRLVRWRLLLRREDGAPYPWTPLWHAVAMGFAANNLLPFRAGEVVRTVTASRLTGARLTTSLASVAVERVFDALTVVGLLAVALLMPGMPAGLSVAGIPVQRVATTAGLLALAALACASLVVAFPRIAERVVRRVIPSDRIALRLIEVIEGIRQGLAVLQSPTRLAGVILWSVVLWLVNALSFYLAFLAFDLPVNYTGAVVLQGILAFGIAVPSAPGYVGPFEAAITAVLALYGIGASQAVAYAVGYHITTFIPITVLGVWSATRTGLGLSATAREAPPDA
ncbi:MAG TPA: lysylphosphatidylglycerol synthase transmembrane domain-containing protein [Gemmatimonadales bacterium]|nr:lysylphosphatidylglycerol synthase transmembrane domain-containing protein [Gemmatimonadales bacterium]